MSRLRFIHFTTVLALVLSACTTSRSGQTTSRPADSPPAGRPPAAGNALRAASPSEVLIEAPVIRIGLLTDASALALKRAPAGYWVIPEGGGSFFLNRGMNLKGPQERVEESWAVQVGALSDERGARALASRIEEEAGAEALVVFDAERGLNRVLAGRFPNKEAADSFRDTLGKKGFGNGFFSVRRPADRPFGTVIRLTDDEGAVHSFNTRSVLVVPVGGAPVEVGGTRYRGGVRLRVNDRGALNVINEINLEDYLRGVVPREMGPEVFNQIEALEAQALAARTYAVRRMGDFAAEGYDLCATAACQVYGGLDAEHPLSDRAVAETRGAVITWNGEPIDALYTSTCGGETSDVSTMFPERSEPYLRSVRCVDLELAVLEGRQDSAVLSDGEARAIVFLSATGLRRAESSWSASDVAQAVTAAARLAGIPVPSSPLPRSVRRGDVLTYMGAALGFESAGRTLLLDEDARYLFPSAQNDPAHLTAAFLIKFGIVPAQFVDRSDLTDAMPRDELHAILESWLRVEGAIRDIPGKIAAIEGRRIEVETTNGGRVFDLAPGIPLIRSIADRHREYRQLPILFGDRTTVVTDRQDRVIALKLEANGEGASFDRTSNFASWVRSWAKRELVDSISARVPVSDLADLRVLDVDGAGRVKRLEVVAENDRRVVLEGIAIRWSLGLPDNLFTMQRSTDPDGSARFTFFGKGWGHGTGMCQVGAYGMAFRGFSADEIIHHYYSGVTIESPESERDPSSR